MKISLSLAVVASVLSVFTSAQAQTLSTAEATAAYKQGPVAPQTVTLLIPKSTPQQQVTDGQQPVAQPAALPQAVSQPIVPPGFIAKSDLIGGEATWTHCLQAGNVRVFGGKPYCYAVRREQPLSGSKVSTITFWSTHRPPMVLLVPLRNGSWKVFSGRLVANYLADQGDEGILQFDELVESTLAECMDWTARSNPSYSYTSGTEQIGWNTSLHKSGWEAFYRFDSGNMAADRAQADRNTVIDNIASMRAFCLGHDDIPGYVPEYRQLHGM